MPERTGFPFSARESQGNRIWAAQWHLPLDWPGSASLPWIHAWPSRFRPLPPQVLHNLPGSRNGTQWDGNQNFRPARTIRFVADSFPAGSWACRREGQGENPGVRHSRILFNPHFRRFLRRRNAGIPAKRLLRRACDSKCDCPEGNRATAMAARLYPARSADKSLLPRGCAADSPAP